MRITARLVDTVVVACTVYAINTVIGSFAADRAIESVSSRGLAGIMDALDGFSWAMIATAVVGVVVTAAYEIGFTTTMRATPGKLLFGFRVVDSSGKTPLDASLALARWLPFGVLVLLARMPIVSLIGLFGLLVLAVVGLALILSSPKRQTPWDVVATTFVVVKPQSGS